MRQISLFSAQVPDGFLYQGDFISKAEEMELVSRMRDLPWAPYEYGPYTALRKVVLVEDPASPPEFVERVRLRIAEWANRPVESITSVLFTHYGKKGVGIGWHYDAPLYDEVFGISLLGDCEMEFRLGDRASTKEKIRVLLERRSVYALTGAARSRWQHRIGSVPSERYSITFRTPRRIRTDGP